MIVYLLIIAGFAMRLVPHLPNFVPVVAIAIFAGAYLNKRTAVILPLAIMVLSDLIIGLHDVILYTWGSFLIIGIINTWMRNRVSVRNVFLSTVFSSLIFFVITNFGVWLTWYPHTAQGLTDCYVKAIPFFRNSLLGNFAYVLVFFGSYEFAKKVLEKTELKTVLLAK